MSRPATRTGLAAVLAASLLLAGCTSGSDDTTAPAFAPASPPAPASEPIQPAAPDERVATDDPHLDAGLSTPVEDRVYPQVGDPGVDALHYDLDLAWDPRSTTLTAIETVVLRATTDADHLQLDLGQALEVSSVTVDGHDTSYDHPGKDLVVHTTVTEDRRYTLVVRYAGSPRPVAAPTTRSDFSTLGWTVTDDGSVWTMQEPFGAYSWYAVNDQPSDKALYDFTITAPSSMTGIANGALVSKRDETRTHTTVWRWHLDEPAASYLVTIAIGHYRATRQRTSDGVPVTFWVPSDRVHLVRGLKPAVAGLEWVEDRLGRYPFGTLGFVLVDSRSGMETQTMITLGSTDYTTSPEVLVHEMVHQWYGDQVTPTDWRDVWMNEGMALYLQGLWQAQHHGLSERGLMAKWAAEEPRMRRESGPPANYDPATFGEGNVYYGPALMWDHLRQRLGEQEFWSLVRAWPRANDDGNASYADITAWWSGRTGQDLRPFFDAWLLGGRSPAQG